MKRFPIGLTLAVAIALAVLVGLGLWQLKRLAWKEALLARIEALHGAPAQPIATALARAARGESVDFVRVAADCGPPPAAAPPVFRYAVRDGQVAWRLMALCRLQGTPWPSILLDRGLVSAFAGRMTPGAAAFPAPLAVVGVLRALGGASFLDPPVRPGPGGVIALQAVSRPAVELIAARAGAGAPAPYLLAVESETPAPAGVVPAALPQDIPNNHFVYALTWFGLAGVLTWIYGAMLWRRLKV